MLEVLGLNCERNLIYKHLGKIIFSAFITCLGLGCSWVITYDSAFYERITKVKIPASFKAVESFDNADGLTITTFKVEHSGLVNFIKTNHLKSVQKDAYINILKSLFRSSYLKGDKPYLNNNDVYYMIGDNSTSEDYGKNRWVFIADANKNLLWVEVTYPGWADGD